MRMLMEAHDVALEVRSSVTVKLPRDEAFRLFTERIGAWWPLSTHSVYEKEASGVTLEPRVGGRMYESASDGRISDWGTVTAWDPFDRVSVTWHPGDDEARATLVDVSFSDAPDGGTLVDLLHTGWEVHGETAREAADAYRSGWPRVLGQFAAAA
ncbi:MAG TPA: SRPBCC family protein [Candidatus Limnocylindria bacterium]